MQDSKERRGENAWPGGRLENMAAVNPWGFPGPDRRERRRQSDITEGEVMDSLQWFHIRAALALVGLILMTVIVGCSEPLVFADWTIPVPEGTRIVEYADVPLEERDGRIELGEDLVIGPRGEDPNYLFYQPQGVAVDAAGRMYVAERGNKRVQVFSAEGEHVRTLGREGQGPGEFEFPAGLTVVGNFLLVHDWNSRRLSIWEVDGDHLGDLPLSDRLEQRIFGTGDGSFVGATGRRLEDRSRVIDVALYSIEGTETVRYTSLLEPDQFMIMGEGGGMVIPQLSGGPSFTASASGVVYATAGEQYQVLAFEPSGSLRWALRVARPAQAFGQEHKDAVLDAIRDRFQDIGEMQLDWPAFLHTLGRLAVDGHGHVYVFPYVFRDMGPDERVEVYSPDGERLFAGTMSERGWSAARGDFVYSMRSNPATEERELVRYRLVEPFDE
jgi:hypothetical protein